jgi:Flp pilus assembly protein TadG
MIRLSPLRSLSARLSGDRSGVAAIEFGIVAPVMALFMMGMGELLYGTYTSAIVLGAVQKAGRDGTLQSNSTATTDIDTLVMDPVRQVAPGATYVSVRQNYATFSDVDKPEPFVDAGTMNGRYDVGECYTDMNGNGHWDADGGRVGVGGANDVAQYTITVTYPHVFPVAYLLGWGANGTITAQTVLKNQPYAAQGASAAPTICT